jgi:hypothetical protein
MARALTGTEEDYAALLLMRTEYKLSQFFNSGWVRDLGSVLLCPDIDVAEFSEPSISAFADQLFERAATKSGRTNASLISDIGKKRRPPSASALDGINLSNKLGRVRPPPPIAPTESCQSTHSLNFLPSLMPPSGRCGHILCFVQVA